MDAISGCFWYVIVLRPLAGRIWLCGSGAWVFRDVSLSGMAKKSIHLLHLAYSGSDYRSPDFGLWISNCLFFEIRNKWTERFFDIWAPVVFFDKSWNSPFSVSIYKKELKPKKRSFCRRCHASDAAFKVCACFGSAYKTNKSNGR